MALPWIFQQLDGPRKRLVLSGASAPHGRRRQSAIVTEKRNARTKTSLYPDSGSRKTRHVFGIEHEPWEFQGRWMDRDLGQGGANVLAEEWKAFLDDRVPIRISWGSIVNFDGFLESITLAREASTDIAYTLHIDIDEDLNASRVIRPAPPLPNPSEATARMMAQIDAAVAPLIRPQKPAIPVSLFDTIADAISVVTGEFGKLANLANEVDDFAAATAAQLDRLLAGIRQGRTALLTLREVYTRVQLDAYAVTRSASDLLETEAAQVQFEATLLAVLASLERMDRETRIARRGTLTYHVTAKDGDTWESIAFAAYGDPDRTDALREANGVSFGDPPVPGRTYMVPR